MKCQCVCPCCHQKIECVISKDGQIEAVFFDRKDDTEEMDTLLNEMGYCFGELKGGDKEK